MKFLFVALMFWSASAHAVKTADCPTTIDTEFGDFNFYLSFDEVDENNSNCVVDCYNEQGMALVQKDLLAAGTIKANLKLAYTLTGRCAYSGQFDGKPFTAEIFGTFLEGSTNKARLVTRWESAVIYSNLASMSPEKIELTNDASQVYYAGEYCSYGDCIVDHIHLGTANQTRVEAVK